MITAAQIRGARALLDISAEQLAETARLGVATVRRAEKPGGPEKLTAANLAALCAALEGAGVEFISDEDGGTGVKLRNRRPAPP